ncbi:unnamed protein product [Blepharisma stoltei]|uniref:C2HC/C3H-type domain-containing protein n=1 Tax=Blepharisma stoltei TaxID=1481888 RepID=A0AAU9K717_9CILI|nr:unnamed protein product [Blepharisma stoltei]
MENLSYVKPKSLVCYLCGREFGTASLGIHQKTCMKLWEEREKLKPPKERRPLPEPPASIPLGSTPKDLAIHNEIAYESFKSKAMIQCPYCERKFLEERFQVHQKSCTAENPCKPSRNSMLFKKLTLSEGIDDYVFFERRSLTPAALTSPFLEPVSPFTPQAAPKPSFGIELKEDFDRDLENLCRDLDPIKEEKIDEKNIEKQWENPIEKDGKFVGSPRGALNNEIRVLQSARSTPMLSKKKNLNIILVECPICNRKFDPRMIDKHIGKCKILEERNQSPIKAAPEVKKPENVIKKTTNVSSRYMNTNSRHESNQKQRNYNEIQPPAAKKEKIFCHICGEKYLPNANYCAYCGIKKVD